MSGHTCLDVNDAGCVCSVGDEEPKPECPMHSGLQPHRCAECGKFMPRPKETNP